MFSLQVFVNVRFRGLRALGSLKRLNECTSGNTTVAVPRDVYLHLFSFNRAVTTSNGVRITVTTAHQPQYSSEKLQEVHAYRIRMCNVSEVPIRLLSRHWFFESGTGGPVIEASGEGVVGQKPFLRAGTTGVALYDGI